MTETRSARERWGELAGLCLTAGIFLRWILPDGPVTLAVTAPISAAGLVFAVLWARCVVTEREPLADVLRTWLPPLLAIAAIASVYGLVLELL